MSLGRIPAQSARYRGDDDTLSSPNIGTDADIMHDNVHCQQLPWANYCSHIPTSPDFYRLPETHKPRAKTIQEAIKRLSESYFKPKKQLNTLQFHTATTGNQVKSQRRNAAITLLQVMFYYCDDATGRVGRRRDDGTFMDLSIKKLALYANLRIKRAKRAMLDIVKAGYLKVSRQFVRAENGDIYALPSMREFTPKLFIELDVKGELWTKWFNNKQWNKERNDKKLTKQDKKKSRALMGLINENLKNMGNKTVSGFKNVVKKVTGLKPSNVDREKKLINLALDMFKRDPSRSATDYLRELRLSYPEGG